MDIRPIRTKRDYERALRRIETLMDADPGTGEGDELEVLATLVDVYEEKHFPVGAADPVEAILFRMDQQGLERKDLEPFIGSRHRVSEVINRKARPVARYDSTPPHRLGNSARGAGRRSCVAIREV